MKKLFICAVALCIAAVGCKSSKKTVANYSSDSTMKEIMHSRMFKVEADSMIMSGKLSVDSVGMSIRYDSSGKISERVYSFKGISSGVKKKRVSKEYVIDEDSVMSKINGSVKGEMEENIDNNKGVGNLWKMFSLVLMVLAAVIIYRVFRG